MTLIAQGSGFPMDQRLTIRRLLFQLQGVVTMTFQDRRKKKSSLQFDSSQPLLCYWPLSGKSPPDASCLKARDLSICQVMRFRGSKVLAANKDHQHRISVIVPHAMICQLLMQYSVNSKLFLRCRNAALSLHVTMMRHSHNILPTRHLLGFVCIYVCTDIITTMYIVFVILSCQDD
jgi:hypothetical protein